MNNGQLHDDKLFQGLHDRLSDYEAPYDGADWDAMSRELDKLPKSNPFRWKFSLNTIGIVLGIAGLTAIGVVMASGNSKPETSNPEKQEVTATPPVSNTVAQPSSNTVNTTFAVVPQEQTPSNSVVVTTDEAGKKTMINGERKSTKSPYFFPDQIDPVKGFVYNTHEDPALLKDHPDIERPEVYYDIVNGKVTPIIIPKDSIKDKWINTIDTSSAKDNKTDNASPSEGQRQGFGDEESQTF
jgi:hypothetical protein